ncbi:MAG: DUF2721 domain-containing protein [Acidobacteriaceae bacterium]|nr:DUF2721 domain-containing protein [Acidobacteriaceae bacterium]
MPGNDAVQVLTAAVTPVVLVSATAILISGINSRYISISDRLRALAHEYRDPACARERRVTIVRELVAFQHRMHLMSWAVRALYAAVAAFIVDAVIISATLWREMLAAATLPLFLTGILLILFALTCQLFELRSSDRTIAIELSDIDRRQN